jgi:hypothetical protein
MGFTINAVNALPNPNIQIAIDPFLDVKLAGCDKSLKAEKAIPFFLMNFYI